MSYHKNLNVTNNIFLACDKTRETGTIGTNSKDGHETAGRERKVGGSFEREQCDRKAADNKGNGAMEEHVTEKLQTTKATELWRSM